MDKTGVVMKPYWLGSREENEAGVGLEEENKNSTQGQSSTYPSRKEIILDAIPFR